MNNPRQAVRAAEPFVFQQEMACTHCGNAMSSSRGECPRCSPRRSARQEELARMRDNAAVPWCCLTEESVHLLEKAAAIHAGEGSVLRRAVDEKVRSSVLELREDIPAEYVTLGSRVTFRVNGQVSLSRVLVHWDLFSAPMLELSLATPWGITLLGMRVSREAPVPWRDGTTEIIEVQAVEAP